jgi:hypothetical protein
VQSCPTWLEGHEKVFAADARAGVVLDAMADIDVFLEVVVVANGQRAGLLWAVAQVLRLAAERAAVADAVVSTHARRAVDARAALDDAAFTEHGTGLDDRVRPHAHARVQIGAILDDGARVDQGTPPIVRSGRSCPQLAPASV